MNSEAESMVETVLPGSPTLLDELRSALHVSQRDDPLLPQLAGVLGAFCASTGNAERVQAWIAVLDWTREGVLRSACS